MKKAGSPTGNSRGFTLVETLLAALVLSCGIVFVVPSFFRAGAALSHVSCLYTAERLANNLIADREQSLRKDRELDGAPLRGRETFGSVAYSYEVEAVPENLRESLYRLTVTVRWKDSRDSRIVRSAFVLR